MKVVQRQEQKYSVREVGHKPDFLHSKSHSGASSRVIVPLIDYGMHAKTTYDLIYKKKHIQVPKYGMHPLQHSVNQMLYKCNNDVKHMTTAHLNLFSWSTKLDWCTCFSSTFVTDVLVALLSEVSSIFVKVSTRSSNICNLFCGSVLLEQPPMFYRMSPKPRFCFATI